MADVSMLQGYLMKEKSKMSLLHGITGDINKRYFRVRAIEGGEELALCYYKNITDPEVRGWIYLKDMTEIAEIQDTIILTSVARTLYLYAQTRAQHNVWVTGLAKLCPEAFVKLGRNAPTQKEMSDGPSTITSRTSPPKPEAGETLSTRNHGRSPNEDTEGDRLIEPQVIPSLVNDEISISSNEDCTRPTFKPIHDHERSKPTVRDNGSSKRGASGSREPGGRNVSWSTPRGDPHRAYGRKGQCSDGGAARAGGESRKKDHRRGRRSSEDGETCSQSSSSDCVRDAEGHKTARSRDKKTSQHGRRRGAENQIAKKDDGIDEQGSDAEAEVNRTGGRKGTGGTDFERNERSMGKQDIRLSSRRSHEDHSDDDSDSNGGDRERGEVSISRNVERVEQRGTRFTGDAATSGARGGQCGMDDGKKSSRHDHGCVVSTPLRACSSDSENVETIELGESIDHNCTAGGLGDRKGTIGQAKQGINGPALESELKGSNQDEERELGEEAESDTLVLPLEILDWEGPRQGQSATSRLHRHISGKDPEARGSANATLPPPKEFLASRPLQSPARGRGENEGKDTPGGKRLEPDSLHLENGLKPARKGRRTSAADLEWSDVAEARDQPRRFEDKISPSTNYGPINLGDSDDDEEDDLDIEIEKQRRRASAAVLALETAAKEADEGAQADTRKGGDCKQRPCENARKKLAKMHRERCVPSPAGPPPAGALRKGRRGQGVPPPRVAPPKLALHTRAELASHRTDSDDTPDNSNWDDEIKTPCHGSPTVGSRASGGLPAAARASEAATASGVTSGGDQGQANPWEHFDD